MRLTIPIIGGEQRARNVQVNNQQSVNLFPVKATNGKTQMTLQATPGTSLISNTQAIARSNGVVFEGWLYFVIGRNLYRSDGRSTATVVGLVDTGVGRCELAVGRNYLMMVDGAAGYTYDGTTFAAISDTDFPNGATHVTYLDGFFIVNEPGTDAFHISTNEDPTDWPFNFANAESNPDVLLALAADEKDLYLFGPRTSQIYYNRGDADFPIKPYQNGVFEFGILAPHSLVRAAEGLFFVAQASEGDLAVMQMRGMQPVEIADEDVVWQMSELGDVSDAESFIYRHRGRSFYVLNFITGDRTFVYDIASDLWHTRESYDKDRWRAGGHGFINNRHIIADYQTGALYHLDYDVYTDGGQPIVRRRRTQVQHKDNLGLVFHELTLEIDSGRGPVLAGGESETFERITNGTFDSDITGWTEIDATVAWNSSSGGVMRMSDITASSVARQSFTTVPGTMSDLTWDIVALTSNDTLTVDIGSSAGASDLATDDYTTTGSKTLSFTATGTTTWVDFTLLDDFTDASQGDIDNVSVLESVSVAPDTDLACPIMQMRYSDDHGRIWSSWLSASMGKLGEYNTLLQWNALGDSKNRIFEFRTAAESEVSISAGYAEVEVLQH